MSASLVGSEMCIRDSARAHAHVRARAQARTRACKRARARAPVWGRGRAVSYTHLTLPTICSV
eukprot:15263852-Alexandrium_andersonii.AAC.1